MVKRYHREAGSNWVQAVCSSRPRPPIYLSLLAQIEIVAALRRTGRIEGMHPSSADALVNLFLRQARTYKFWQVTPAVSLLAIELCNKYWSLQPGPLRALDAIQLASALFVSASLDGDLAFVTADLRLGAIATFEGLRVINPAFPPST